MHPILHSYSSFLLPEDTTLLFSFDILHASSLTVDEIFLVCWIRGSYNMATRRWAHLLHKGTKRPRGYVITGLLQFAKGFLMELSVHLCRSLSRWYSPSLAVPRKPSSCEMPCSCSQALQVWTTTYRSPQKYVHFPNAFELLI